MNYDATCSPTMAFSSQSDSLASCPESHGILAQPHANAGVWTFSDEIWSLSKSDHHNLQTIHPWGCPAYVLDPKLREGGKIPKWAPRSHCGQYMGHSTIHTSSVGLVRHLQTAHISPQFHMVYNDYFETIHSDESDQPPPE